MVLLAHIRSQFQTSHETYGSPRMTVELKEDGLRVGRHRVTRLMRDNGIKALQKGVTKKRPIAIMRPHSPQYPRTGFQRHGAEPEMGCRYLVYLDDRRLALSSHRSGPLFQQDHRLGGQQPAE
jgi:transposase InsO family protein